MIEIYCDRCGKQLDKFGTTHRIKKKKWHSPFDWEEIDLCHDCEKAFMDYVKPRRLTGEDVKKQILEIAERIRGEE